MAEYKPEYQQWEAIYTTNSEPMAHFIAGKLQNEGIEAIIQKESAGSAYGISVGLLGKVDVLVRSTDFDRAMAVLEDEDYEEDSDEDEDDDYDDEEEE